MKIKHYIIVTLLLLIIVAMLLIFNKKFMSTQYNAAITTKGSEEYVAELADISKKMIAINQRLATLGDRVDSLEHRQVESQQQLQTNSIRTKTVATSAADGPTQESGADSELAFLVQSTGVTATQLATMNGSEIEKLNEKHALEQDKQYFMQLERHFYSDKSETFDRVFEQSITDSVNLEELSNSRVSNISCDSSICRVEVKHSDPITMNKFLDKVPGLPLWNTEAVVDFPEAGDKPTSIIYLARKGHSLPARSAQSQ